MKIVQLATMFSTLLFCSSLSANTIAVSEFLSNPEGEDSGREFVELYNYGTLDVDVAGYTVTDEGTDSYTLPSVILEPNEYLILVNTGGDMSEAQAKSVFEQAWLGGNAHPNVIGANLGALSNSSDEIIIGDGTTTIWSLAYGNDEDEDSTLLTDLSFGTITFGDQASPGIDRSGDDNGVSGFLGYEDSGGGYSAVWSEDVSAIDDAIFLESIGLDADFYDGIGASEAAPFMLTIVPEPSLNAFGIVVSLLFLRRRCGRINDMR